VYGILCTASSYYIDASTCLFDDVKDFGVSNDTFSDHSPLYCTLSFEQTAHNSELSDENEDVEYIYEKIRWKERFKIDFFEKFTGLYNSFETLLLRSGESSVDLLGHFTEIIRSAAYDMTVTHGPRKYDNFLKQPPWWNHECTRLKKQKYYRLKLFRSSNNSQDLERYKLAKKDFKHNCYLQKMSYQRDCKNKLVSSRTNPKAFWNLVKSTHSNQNSNRTKDITSK